jgi:hypothetical protein
MRRLSVGALLAGAALACATPGRGAPSGLDDGAAREVLRRFARAVEAGRPAEALPLLSARWRAAYTPERLAADLAGAGPAARDAAARVLAALDAGVALDRGAAGARLPVGAGRAAVLVPEGGAWRVDALE